LLPKLWSMAGYIYVVGAVLAGLMFMYYAVRILGDHSRVRARAVLLASVVYLPILYGLLVFDHTGL
jgi:protoheme IX farnesyltransferase